MINFGGSKVKIYSSEDVALKDTRRLVGEDLPKRFQKLLAELQLQKLDKSQQSFFPEGSNIKILKRYTFKMTSRKEEDIDIYQPYEISLLIKKLRKENIKIVKEPDRIDFKFEEVDYDIHKSLSFWGLDFIPLTKKEKDSRSIYLSDDKELLFYIAHSIYKHGLIEKSDLLSVIKLIRNVKVDLKECYRIANINGWGEGFIYFMNHLNRVVKGGEFTDLRVPILRYTHLWVRLLHHRKYAQISPFFATHYAYLRESSKIFDYLAKVARKTPIIDKISFYLGYKY